MLPPPPSATSHAPSVFDAHEPKGSFDAFVAALAGDDPELLYDRAPCGYLTTAARSV
jgi:hypothetical protein